MFANGKHNGSRKDKDVERSTEEAEEEEEEGEPSAHNFTTFQERAAHRCTNDEHQRVRGLDRPIALSAYGREGCCRSQPHH